MNHLFAEMNQVCQGFLPVAMNSAANAGDYMSMKNYGRLTVVFFKAVGTAGDDPTITLQQAQDVSGTGVKALTINRVDKKQAASNLLAVGQFTVSTPASPATNDTFATNTWTNSDLAEQAAIVLIDVKAEDLDADNNFDCVRATIADVGTNAQLGCLLYILSEPRFAASQLPSAIAD